MRNLTIEQQKEFEKLLVEIKRLHNENNELVKENREREKRDNNIKIALKKEIDKFKKDNLRLIQENKSLNKKLSSYKKHNDMPSEEEYEDYYNALENEYCE